MATLYVNDGGSDTSPYDTWAKAANLMASALADAACVAGSTIYVQSDHVEQYAANQILSSANGTAANPITIISVTNTNEPPVAGDYQNMATGGGRLDGDTGGAYDIFVRGWDIWIGLLFMSGDDFSTGTEDVDTHLIDCKVTVCDNSYLTSYSDGCAYWENVDFEQITIGSLEVAGNFYWKGGSFKFNGGGIEVNFLELSGSGAGNIIIEDVDIQDLDVDDYLVSDANPGYDVLFKRCKIPAACNYMNTGPTGGACRVRFHSVDDGNFIYKFKEYYFEGKIEDAINCYLNATYDGTNGYSAKMTSNANAREWTRPLRFKLAEVWCSANPTLTVETITSNVTLQNDEFWIEIEYPDSAIGAYGKIDQTSRLATILTAPANLTASVAAWTEDLANEVKQKIAVTIAGGQAGMHTVWACLAKPSTTVYVDPKITVT